jgi:hypothetical protein
MKLNKKEKLLLKNYLNSIMGCICSFLPEEKADKYIKKSQTLPELLGYISNGLKDKEVGGWLGEDLKEEQLDVLTIISEFYLKKNKSKYKKIEKPSEIIIWFAYLIESVFTKKELMLNQK